MASPLAIAHAGRSPSADQASWDRLIRHARCADAGLDPDQWFPVSAEAAKARLEAAAAIAICDSCLVRTGCLALSLRHWDIGQHGIWGGLVATERARLRRLLPRTASDAAVSALMHAVVTASAR
jgi:hypothetical protein